MFYGSDMLSLTPLLILFLQLAIDAHFLMFENAEDKQIQDTVLNIPEIKIFNQNSFNEYLLRQSSRFGRYGSEFDILLSWFIILWVSYGPTFCIDSPLKTQNMQMSCTMLLRSTSSARFLHLYEHRLAPLDFR